jgi:hypothetical protein
VKKFKKSKLKNLEVWRDIEPIPGCGFKICIKVVEEEEINKVYPEGGDMGVCKALIVGIEGYLDEKDNEMPVDMALADMHKSVVVLCSQTIFFAQQDALIKN